MSVDLAVVASVGLMDPDLRRRARWEAAQRIKPNREVTRLLIHADTALRDLLSAYRGDVVADNIALDMLLALLAGSTCPGVSVLVAPMRFVLAALAEDPLGCAVVAEGR